MLDLQNKKNNASAPKVAFEILYRANIRGVNSIIKQKVFERDLSRVRYAISGSLPVKLPVK